MKKLGTPASGVTIQRGDEEIVVRPAVSYVKPVCSQGHDPSKIRREAEGWVCLDCLDTWFAEQTPQSQGGVELPTGVVDARKRFSPAMPNRRVRRRYK